MLSITVRPRIEHFKVEWADKLVQHFIRCKLKYVVSIEQNTHLQIALETVKRSNNVRRSIISQLNFTPHDDDEARSWLVVKVHKEPMYLVGYCLKECQTPRTNYTETHIRLCEEYYQERKDSLNKQNYKWVCAGMNNLFPAVWKYVNEGNVNLKQRPLRTLLALMLSEDKIPLSLAKKFTSKDEHLWIAYRSYHMNYSKIQIIEEVEKYFLDQ